MAFTVTLPSAIVQGRVTSPSAVVPAGHMKATVEFIIPSADRDRITSILECFVEYSSDGGATYKPIVMAGWRGGTGIRSKDGLVLNPAPSLTVAGPGLAARVGQLVRCGVDAATPLMLGATLRVF